MFRRRGETAFVLFELANGIDLTLFCIRRGSRATTFPIHNRRSEVGLRNNIISAQFLGFQFPFFYESTNASDAYAQLLCRLGRI